MKDRKYFLKYCQFSFAYCCCLQSAYSAVHRIPISESFWLNINTSLGSQKKMEGFFSLCGIYTNIAIQRKWWTPLAESVCFCFFPKKASFYVQVHLYVCIQPPCGCPTGVRDPLGKLCNAGTCTFASAVSLPARAILIWKLLDSDSKAPVPVCKDYATLAGAG